MSKLNSEIYISSEVSKKVLNSIILKKKVNLKKLKIEHLKNKIDKLNKDYLFIKKKSTNLELNYKYFLFWEIIKNKYDKDIITLKKRKQKNNKKVNIIFSKLNQSLGYNPSLLTILIFDKEIKNVVTYDNFFNELEKYADFEKISSKKKILFINKIKKGKIHLITPLCPDYEHVKIAMGLYKYTFNKLNDGIGLIGKRLINIIEKVHSILNKYDIKFDHILYYGDFEAYSQDILSRTKENEISFINKIKKSAKKMKVACPSNLNVRLLVKSLSTKKRFLLRCKNNEIKIRQEIKKNISFKKIISEISDSRASLYSSWYPNAKETHYQNLVIKQGAEYTTMGELFSENYDNPVVLGLDHSKMGLFYGIFNELISIYGRPKYV